MRSFFVYIIKRDDFCNSICYNEWGTLNEIRGIIKNNNKHGLYLDLYDFIQQFEPVRLAEIRKQEEQEAQKKKHYLQTRVFT